MALLALCETTKLQPVVSHTIEHFFLSFLSEDEGLCVQRNTAAVVCFLAEPFAEIRMNLFGHLLIFLVSFAAEYCTKVMLQMLTNTIPFFHLSTVKDGTENLFVSPMQLPRIIKKKRKKERKLIITCMSRDLNPFGLPLHVSICYIGLSGGCYPPAQLGLSYYLF